MRSLITLLLLCGCAPTTAAPAEDPAAPPAAVDTPSVPAATAEPIAGACRMTVALTGMK